MMTAAHHRMVRVRHLQQPELRHSEWPGYFVYQKARSTNEMNTNKRRTKRRTQATGVAAPPLNQAEVKEQAPTWYKKLDLHVPIGELLPLLADDEFEMRSPGGASRGHAGFQQWYDRTTRIFFDETHRLEQVKLEPSNGADRSQVKVVVN
jgi:hypothetical protein